MKYFLLFVLALSVNAQKLDFKDLAAINQLKGAKVLFKFGVNSDVDNGGEEDCWGGDGDYNFLTAASTITLTSSSSADTASGTGARTVLLSGLNSNYEEIEETFTTNGTGLVTGDVEFYRVTRARVKDVGSGGVNAGTLTFSANGTVTPVIYITADEGQSTLGVYTVPKDNSLLMDKFYSAILNKSTALANFHFEVRPPPINGVQQSWNLKQVVALGSAGNSSFERVGAYPFFVPEKYDIRIRIHDVNVNDTALACAFDGLLIMKGTFLNY